MRNSSSRHVVGKIGAELNDHAPSPPEFGAGIKLKRPWIVGSFALNPGITFRFGVCPVLSRNPGTAGQSPIGSTVGGAARFGHKSLKSPVRCAAPGTGTLKTCPGTRSRRHSCDQKKNVFCFSVL